MFKRKDACLMVVTFTLTTNKGKSISLESEGVDQVLGSEFNAILV